MEQVSQLRSYAKEIVASAARTADGNSGALKLPRGKTYGLTVVVSAASGTSPTMDLYVQASNDGGTTFRSVSKFAQITAALAAPSGRRLVFGHSGYLVGADEDTMAAGTNAAISQFPLTRDYRILWDIGGTNPSFTFSVDLFVEPF